MLEDTIGLIILILTAIALAAAAGFALLVGGELLCAAISWTRLPPAAGWAALGMLAGALGGVAAGMKERGKGDDLRLVYYGAGGAALALITAGVLSPAGRALLGW